MKQRNRVCWPAAVVVAGAMLVAAPAQALDVKVQGLELTVFGRAHLSVDHLDNGDESSQYLNTNSSRLGVRASMDTGVGIIAEAQYLTRVALDDGGSDLFAGSRESYLGIRGDLGVLRAGRITAPMMVAMDRFQLFGDQVGDAGNFFGGGGLVNRYANTVVYSTSDWWGAADPWRFTAGFIPAGGGDRGPGFLFGVDYEEGPLFVNLGVNHFRKDADALGENEKNMTGAQLWANYTIGQTLLQGAVQGSKNRNGADDADDFVYLLGARHGLTDATFLKAHVLYLDADASDSDALMAAIGLDHFLSSRLRVYIAAAMTDNDSEQNKTPWGWGHADRSNPNPSAELDPGAFDQTTYAVSVGARFDF